MKKPFFKYKALSLTPEGGLDQKSLTQVIQPIADSYFYLPTREKLNDPNEGIYINQIQAGITGFLQGVSALGEKNDLLAAFHNLARQITQSTDNSGVFSLAGNVTDELLWAHYASSHCGIAIEYDLEQLTRFCPRQLLHCFPVTYIDNPPNLDFHHMEDNGKAAISNMLGHKSPRWQYEEEFRVLLENKNGEIPHDYRAVKSITFGLKVSEDLQEIIYQATKHKVSQYYQIRKIPGTYIFERNILNNFVGQSPKGKTCEIDWTSLLTGLEPAQKKIMIELMQQEIESDPHFKELYNAEKSTEFKSKAYLQYESEHVMPIIEGSQFTKHYYEL